MSLYSASHDFPVQLAFRSKYILLMLALLMTLVIKANAKGLPVSSLQPSSISVKKKVSESQLKLSPDLLGLRAIYRKSRVSLDNTMPNRSQKSINENIYGSAISVEWALFHHHLELELIVTVRARTG